MTLTVAQQFWNLFSDFIAQKYPRVKDTDYKNVELGWRYIFRQIYDSQYYNSEELWPDFRRFLDTNGDSLFVYCTNDHFSKMLDAILLQKGPIFSPGGYLDGVSQTTQKTVFASKIPQAPRYQTYTERFAALNAYTTDDYMLVYPCAQGEPARKAEPGCVSEVYNSAERALNYELYLLKLEGQTYRPNVQAQQLGYQAFKSSYQEATQLPSNPDTSTVDILGVLEVTRNSGYQASAEFSSQLEGLKYGNPFYQDNSMSTRQMKNANFWAVEQGATVASTLSNNSKSSMPVQNQASTTYNLFLYRKFEPSALPPIPVIGSALLYPPNYSGLDYSGGKFQDDIIFYASLQNTNNGYREENRHSGICMQFYNQKPQMLSDGITPAMKKSISSEMQLPPLFEVYTSVANYQNASAYQGFYGLATSAYARLSIFSSFSSNIQSLSIPTISQPIDESTTILDLNADFYFGSQIPAGANQPFNQKTVLKVNNTAASGRYYQYPAIAILPKEYISCFANLASSQAKVPQNRTYENYIGQQKRLENNYRSLEFFGLAGASTVKKPSSRQEKYYGAYLTWADVAHYKSFNVCSQQVVPIDYQPFSKLHPQDSDGKYQVIKRRVLLGYKPACLIPSAALNPVGFAGKRLGKYYPEKMQKCRPTAEHALGYYITPYSSSCNKPMCRLMKRNGSTSGFDSFYELGLQPFYNQLVLTNYWRVHLELPMRTGKLGSLD